MLLPRGLAVLKRRLPEAVAAIEAAGGHRWHLLSRDTLDDRYEFLSARRQVLESALTGLADRAPHVEVQRGVGVSGLLTRDSGTGGAPLVHGVTTDCGERLEAGLVVDAGGGGSPVGAMLGDLQHVTDTALPPDAGFDFYTRYFRSPDGTLPPRPAWPLEHYDSVSTLALPSDNGAWSLTLVVSRRDWVMRSLYEEHVWDRTAALFPALTEWVGYGRPVTGVLATAGPGTRRRSVVRGGRPSVTGLVSVGDAWGTTNPEFCQGLSMALIQAELLCEAVRAERDPARLVLAYESAAQEALGPFYATSRFWEQNRLAEIYAAIRGRRFHGGPDWTAVMAMEAAKLADPDVLTAISDIGSMLAAPVEAMSRPEVVSKALSLAAGSPAPAPTRATLLSTLSR
ncbi:putative secreted protein [[Actinomadura] parvosata subsp. kistnae]|nr:putative secreted protein [Actinomadura parvosata subsp. kistnae]